MSCFHPLNGFYTGRKTENGKNELVIVKGNDSFCNVNLVRRKCGNLAYDPDFMIAQNGCLYLYKNVQIPCGQCIGCRLEYSRQWAIRCMLESKCYPEDSCSFLTLTYDNAHVPPSLVKKDMSDFMKRLRAQVKRDLGYDGVRFFGCGEYGSEKNTHRPHFHLILFNYCFTDLRLFDRRKGNDYFTSAWLSKLWPFGLSVVGKCTFESCAYVARYVVKKKKRDPNSDEFVLMSRRPGIGRPYLDRLGLSAYETDKIYENVGFTHEFTPPKYYDRLMEKVDPDKVEVVKAARLVAAVSNICTERIMHEFDDEEDLLNFQEELKKRKVERLKRTLQ